MNITKERCFRIALYAMVLLVYTGSTAYSQPNDHIFPAAVSARPYISFDAKGFLINGKRTFLVSAGMEYARVPRALWRDRLLRLKRDGFNCVEFYTFWNFHEPHEGQFEFSGDHDLNAFLQLVHQMGMYAIARVGPYYCAEWNSGGYPIWLRFKDSLKVRSAGPLFEKYVDQYFSHLLPIIARNQINHGGAVILVQLENEYPGDWGTYVGNAYFKHLQQDALSEGIQVPYFFSGLHHSSDPAGDKKSLDDSSRPNPWFTTEFWSVWYNRYGSDQHDADTYGRRTWKIIAHGGNGYNYYMAHGGSNFGYSNSNEDAASYDYGAAVGQTGDLRPIYYQFKRNAFFARSFQDILENSSNTVLYQDIATNRAIKINTRRSPAGDIVFLYNAGDTAVHTRLQIMGRPWPLHESLTLAGHEIMPVVHNYSLTDHVGLEWGVVRILGISRTRNTCTLVVYGAAGSPGDLAFSLTGNPTILSQSRSFKRTKDHLDLNFSFSAKYPVCYTFKCGVQTIRVLAVNKSLSDRTWFVGAGGNRLVIVGPEYVGAVRKAGSGHFVMMTEHFWQQQHVYDSAWIYGENLDEEVRLPLRKDERHSALLAFHAAWEAKNASLPANPQFNDSGWKASKMPLQMGADGNLSAYAWYRTTVNIKDSGSYRLLINEGGDRFIVFADGRRVAAGNLNDLQFPMNAGSHTLAIFAGSDGRDKLYNFMGELGKVNIKGLAGAVWLTRGRAADMQNWKMLKVEPADHEKSTPSFVHAASYETGKRIPAERRGFTWFQTILPKIKGHIPVGIRFAGIGRRAVVFINGKKVGSGNQYYGPLFIPYRPGNGKADSLTILMANGRRYVGITNPVTVIYKDDISATGWHMKGGPGRPASPAGWKELKGNETFDRPYFFRNHFVIDTLGGTSHPVWRINFNGLSHGSIWVNGHNLGRYPEKVPIHSTYIPGCWLKRGTNTLVIYDEYGNRPDKVRIEAEMASSRDDMPVRF